MLKNTSGAEWTIPSVRESVHSSEFLAWCEGNTLFALLHPTKSRKDKIGVSDAANGGADEHALQRTEFRIC